MVNFYHRHGKVMIQIKSKVAIKILDYYFINPQARHYINEIARMLELDPKNVNQKLKEFEKDGFFKSEFQGKERYFFLAKENPVLEHYRQIFLKTYGLEKKLKEALNNIVGIKEAYIYGSYAKDVMDSASDIDILAIGTHSVLDLQKSVSVLQKNIGREFNIINMSEREFAAKKNDKDAFIRGIFKTKVIRLV
jgi:predicted nucleotidyltransferase